MKVLCITGFLLLSAVSTAAASEILSGFVMDGEYWQEVITQSISPFGSITPIDLGGDGIDELVIGAREGEEPEVVILRADGSVVSRWLAYEKAFRGGVRISVADFDDDGKSEIITAPGEGGGPHVRVFDATGREKYGLFAFDNDNKYGINAVSVVRERGAKPIVLVTGWEDKNFVGKFFDARGAEQSAHIIIPSFSKGTYVRMFAFDLGTDGRQELILVGERETGYGIVLARLDGSIINQWKLEDLGSVNALALHRQKRQLQWVNQDGVLVTQDLFGKILSEKELSVTVAPRMITASIGTWNQGAESELLLFHSRPHLAERGDKKYIEISLAQQQLRYYEKGVLVNEYLVSTGRPGAPTPTGEFKIENKFDNAWSRTAKLWMPYWMAFVPDGTYGIHRLPYWPVGLIEGETSLGRKVSGGCVRLGIEEAKKLYEWADIGTPVYIN